METLDLRFTREDGVRLFVLADALVELPRDALEVWSRDGTKRKEAPRVLAFEADVTLQLVEPGFNHWERRTVCV